MKEQSEWISIADAVKLSGYHPDHLRRLIRSKLIKAEKFSIVWRVERSSLISYQIDAENSVDNRRGAKKNLPKR